MFVCFFKVELNKFKMYLIHSLSQTLFQPRFSISFWVSPVVCHRCCVCSLTGIACFVKSQGNVNQWVKAWKYNVYISVALKENFLLFFLKIPFFGKRYRLVFSSWIWMSQSFEINHKCFHKVEIQVFSQLYWRHSRCSVYPVREGIALQMLCHMILSTHQAGNQHEFCGALEDKAILNTIPSAKSPFLPALNNKFSFTFTVSLFPSVSGVHCFPLLHSRADRILILHSKQWEECPGKMPIWTHLPSCACIIFTQCAQDTFISTDVSFEWANPSPEFKNKQPETLEL